MIFSPMVERAIELAAEWHDRTYRKSRWRPHPFDAPAGEEAGRIPVMAHVTAVALSTLRAGWEDEVVAAAFLHDVLEDRNRFGDHMTERSLETLMGEEVTVLVQGVTEPKFGDDGKPLPWRQRKETYLDTLQAAPVGALAISLADKLHNAWTMAQGLEAGSDIFTPGRGRTALSAGPVDQLWFYRAVLTASQAAEDPRLPPMREALDAEVARFARLAGITERASGD